MSSLLIVVLSGATGRASVLLGRAMVMMSLTAVLVSGLSSRGTRSVHF